MTYLRLLWTKYDQFGGRAGRREFWQFMAVHIVLLVIAWVIDYQVLLRGLEPWYVTGPPLWSQGIFAAPTISIYFYISIVPALALGSRRLHDTGRSGWWQVFMVSWVPAAMFAALRGTASSTGVDVDGYDDLLRTGYDDLLRTLTLVFFSVALLGTLVFFIFALLRGDEDANRYGQPGLSPDRPVVYWTVLTTRYAKFSGRAGRKEFWLFALVSAMIGYIAATLDQWLFASLDPLGDGTGMLGLILFLATIVPYIALVTRRFHDIGRSGWWQLLWLAGVFGLVILLFVLVFVSLGLITIGLTVLALIACIRPVIWLCKRSQEGENKYGEPPIAPT